MDNVFHGLLARWSSGELQVVLQLMAQDARAREALAGLLLSDLVWIDLAGDGRGRELLWIEALEAAALAPDGPAVAVWRRALAIGAVWMALGVQCLMFGDNHVVYGLFCSRPPPQSEVQRMLPVIWRHLNAWAQRQYRDPARFVAAVAADWIS